MSQQKDSRTFPRFEVVQRTEHLLLLLSFTLLAITGLPQKYPEYAISQWIIQLFGGIEIDRSIHHVSAIVLIVLSIFHAIHIGYRLYVKGNPPGMLPFLRDVKDFVQTVSYNVGASKTKPKMEHFNFVEKIEYWAVVWGTVVMAITGYVLWNPIIITKYLPGEVVPASKVAHGMEAILAVLSILTWHVYTVHLKYFNRSIFTGKISYHEMEEEHAAELERIRTGDAGRPAPSPETQWKRARIYLPIAGVVAVVLLLFTYRFFTIESTAITTVPPQPYEEVYVPSEPPGLPTATPAAIAAESEVPQQRPLPTPQPPNIVSHPVDETRADCMACHNVYGYISPAPFDHAERTNEECLTCHQATQEVAQQ